MAGQPECTGWAGHRADRLEPVHSAGLFPVLSRWMVETTKYSVALQTAESVGSKTAVLVLTAE